MGELVYTKAFVLFGTSASPTTTLAKKVRSVAINYSAEIQDKTAMGANSRARISGLLDSNVTIEFNQDFASSDFDKFQFNSVGKSSTDFWLDIRPTTEKGSATNPRYTGNFVMEGYNPISGSVGDLAVHSVTYQADGDLSRLITTGPQ